MATVFSVSRDDARNAHDPVRCFKCPRERQEGEPGWHFFNPSKVRGALRYGIVHVCPVHYGQFAVTEQMRWEPLFDLGLAATPPEPSMETPGAPAGVSANVPGPEPELAAFAGGLLLPAPVTTAP